MPFSKCFFHIVWATAERQALITEAEERLIYGVIRNKANEHRIDVLGVNGTVDHIHLAVKVPPSIAISDWIGKVKGASSRAIGDSWSGQGRVFRWQEGFGVLTFGERNLSLVIDYIRHQKQHHADNSLIAYLERDQA